MSQSKQQIIEQSTPVVAFLRRRFLEAQRRNRLYSMRSFAKHLGCSPSTLSEIFAAKRPVTTKQVKRFAKRLALSPLETANLLVLASQSSSHWKEARSNLQQEISEVALGEEQFQLIAEWQHFAILSLLETEGFKSSPAWIAQRLGISKIAAEDALERLKRLRLVREGKGALLPGQSGVTTSHDIPSAAIRQSHRQGLEGAIRALEEVDVELRDITAMNIAIDPAQLPEAKRLIREFRRGLTALLEAGKKKEVYRFGIQLYPLTHHVMEK